MRTLAKEFGLSDVGLAKLCRRHDIPTPGLGYWRLVETGHPPHREPLKPTQPQNENVAISAREPKPYELPLKADLLPVPTIEVASDRQITHSLAIRSRKLFEPTSKNDRGHFLPKTLKAPHLRISGSGLSRALRILDAFYFALEAQGYQLTWETSPDAQMNVDVDGTRIHFCLSESFDRRPHSLTPEENARKKKGLYVYTPRWDYMPSGTFRLSINNMPYELGHLRTSWNDGKMRRVEKCLGDCVAILPHIARAIQLVHEQRERERKEREEEQKREEELRRKREEYNRKTKIAEQFLELRHKSRSFREFASALDKKRENASVDDKQKQEIREISNWIARHAENLDPLQHFDWMIRKFNESSD